MRWSIFMLFIAVAIVCGICTVIFYRRENSERWEAYLFGVMSGSSFLLACLQVGMRIVEKILG
ncbi:hypothetical protein [Secundilactobacillus collinoides]|nr:hypothetical protein [Secundilactobacillus collinoides]KZL35679.1 hypothetical protein TY91_15920 [Secundilactobacillus collinoides]